MTQNRTKDFSKAEHTLNTDENEDVQEQIVSSIGDQCETECEAEESLDTSSESSCQSSEVDSEEEKQHTPTKHKTKKRPRCGFVLDEAEVDDETTDDEAGEEDEIGSIFTNKNERGPTARDIEGRHRNSTLFHGIESETELEAYLKNKYEAASSDNVNDEVPEYLIQPSLLPGVKDPCLWLVRCTPGTEQETMLLLTRKILSLSQTTQASLVKSVIAPKSARGFLYFEAYKQSCIKQLIEGVSNLKRGQFYIKLVPTREMSDVLRVCKPQIKPLKPGRWVRPAKGLYKQDLAQVDIVDDIRGIALLKLIPRLNLKKYKQSQANKKDLDGEIPPLVVKKRRNEAKLFDPESVAAVGGRISRDGDFAVFEGNKFSTQGFLFKEFKVNSLITQGIKPTLNELEKFQLDVEEMEIDSSEAVDNIQEVTLSYNIGDKVVAVEGELKNLIGKVTAVNGNNISVLPSHEDIKEVIELPASDLAKHFDLGDQVKVISGCHEGNTGLVIRVDTSRVIVISDMSFAEMEMRPRDLSITMTKSSGVDSVGHFQFGDLVNVSSTDVAVIIRLDRDIFQVLTMHNNVMELKPQALQIRRQSYKPQGLDSEQNSICSKDVVKIVDGPHIGLGGIITHIYRSYAFVQCKSLFKNSGLVACRMRSLLLAGESKISSQIAQDTVPYMSPSQRRENKKKTYFSHQVYRDHHIIGKTVKIISGSYKGNIGIVKDATERLLRVELMSVCRDVYFDRNHVSEIDGYVTNFFRKPDNVYGSLTPLHTPKRLGDNTPMYGLGAMTPHYGGSTPNYQPVLSQAWDPDSYSASRSGTSNASSCDMDLSCSPYDPSSSSGGVTPNEDMTAPVSYSPSKNARYGNKMIPGSPQYSPSEPQNDKNSENQSTAHHFSSFESNAAVNTAMYGCNRPPQISYISGSPQYNPNISYRPQINASIPYSPSSPNFTPSASPRSACGGASPCSPPFSPLEPDFSDRASFEDQMAAHKDRSDGRNMSPDCNNKPWLRPGLCVHVNSKDVDGIVTHVNKMHNKVDVKVMVEGMEEKMYMSSDITPGKVNVHDRVLIIDGDCTGMQGQALSIEYLDAIVSLHANDIKMIQLQFLCPFKY